MDILTDSYECEKELQQKMRIVQYIFGKEFTINDLQD